jgi:hypothetical protein
MTSVYKTLAGKDSHEKVPGEKSNKQRVLILVLLRVKNDAPELMNCRAREVSPCDIAICCKTCTR